MRRIALIALLCFGATLCSAQSYTPNCNLFLAPSGYNPWWTPMNENLTKIDNCLGVLQNFYRGTWSSSTIYVQYQQVSYEGSLYISLQNSNYDQNPATATSYWELYFTGGSGSMTWPSLAGIPNYNGSGGWGTSYSTTNTIPANFISSIPYSQLTGTPTIPTVNSASTYSPAYYSGATAISGATPFTGLGYFSTSAAPVAADSAQVQNAIGSGVYDVSGAAAARAAVGTCTTNQFGTATTTSGFTCAQPTFANLVGNLGTGQGPSGLTGLLKDTAGTLSAAVAGTDYVIPSGSITGNAGTATNLASYPTPCSGGQFSQGLSAGSNNCSTPTGGGNVSGSGTSVAGNFAVFTNTSSTAIGPGSTAYGPSSFDAAGSASTAQSNAETFATNSAGGNTINATQVNGAAVPASALFMGSNSSHQPVAATAANLATFLASLTGCGTAGYVYSPASGNCTANGGSAVVASLQFSLFYQPNSGSSATAQGDPDATTDGVGDLQVSSIKVGPSTAASVLNARARKASTLTTAGQIYLTLPNAPGTGYSVGNVLTIVQSGASGGTVTVASVNGSGGVTGFTANTVASGVVTALGQTTVGASYSTATGLATTGGGGSGATVNIWTDAQGDETQVADATGSSTCTTGGGSTLVWTYWNGSSWVCPVTSQVYPASGIAVSTGSAWGSSLAAPASAIVGVSDTQTLTNKSIAASEINSGTLAAAQMPALTGDCTTTSGTVATNCAHTVTTLTDASPIAWTSAGNISNAVVTLAHTTSTRALNLSGLASGDYLSLIAQQDSTGGAYLTGGTGCTWMVNGSATSTFFTSAPGASSYNIIAIMYDGTNCWTNISPMSVSSSGTTTNPLTMNSSGAGATSGSTFNGSAAQTISYNTIGAAPAAGSSSITTLGTIATGTWNGGIVQPAYGGTGVANTATQTLGTSNRNYATLGTGFEYNTTTTGAVTNATAANLGTLINLAQYDFLLSGGTSAAPTGLACTDGKVVQGSATTPSCTATPTLGASGTLGSVTMGNATSGTLTLEPTTGELGTITEYLPVASGDTLVSLASTQTLTNKTLTSPTLTTPALGTPASGVITNLTGTCAACTASNITATSNSTIASLTSLSLPYSQLSGPPSTSMTLNGTSCTLGSSCEVPYPSGGWTSGNNTNGYWIKDPLGHLHEWGHLTGESTSCNLITFPAAFTTLASIAPSATDDFAVGSSIQHSIVVSPSHGCTGISISAMYDWVSSTGGNGVWWTADGY